MKLKRFKNFEAFSFQDPVEDDTAMWDAIIRDPDTDPNVTVEDLIAKYQHLFKSVTEPKTTGLQKKSVSNKYINCPDCDGQDENCPTCDGSGKILR